MEKIDNSNNCRLMDITKPDATIYYAQALFKLTINLQLELQFLQFLHIMEDNMKLPYSSLR